MRVFNFRIACLATVAVLVGIACKKGVQQQKDELYSRHLQRTVKLDIIHTPMPDDKEDLSLLIINDAKSANIDRIAKVTDSLQKAALLQPLVVVVTDGVNKKDEYGIADNIKTATSGTKADHYADFIHNELYPYAKKKAGVRKFKAVIIAGFETGAVSALDIAWTHPDKISKVGIFSAGPGNKAPADTVAGGAMYEKLKASRKRPALQYWFYAGKNVNDTAIDWHTRAVIKLLQSKSFIHPTDVVIQTGLSNGPADWASAMPAFIQWAAAK